MAGDVSPVAMFFLSVPNMYHLRGCSHITSAAGGGEGVWHMLTMADEGVGESAKSFLADVIREQSLI